MEFPISSVLVAADAIWKQSCSPDLRTRSCIMNCAIGLRQILPWHTKSIRFIVKLLLSLIDFSITYQLGVREAFSHRGKGKKEEMDIFLPVQRLVVSCRASRKCAGNIEVSVI